MSAGVEAADTSAFNQTPDYTVSIHVMEYSDYPYNSQTYSSVFGFDREADILEQGISVSMVIDVVCKSLPISRPFPLTVRMMPPCIGTALGVT